MFNSYFENPSGISFEGQELGEKVILFLRQHFVVLISWFVVVTLMSLVPFAFFGLVSFFEVDITTVISGPYWIVATLLWFLITFGVLFEKLVSWFNNTYILTNERIIDVDFHNLLSKKVSYAHLDNIEDVSQAVGGIARLFFDYGHVHIQTAAEQREFDFHSVPQPAKVSLAIQKEARLEKAEPDGVIQ